MSSLKQMKTQVLKFRNDRDWAQFHGAKDLMLGLLVEAGELAEHFQYLTGDELKQYQQEFKEHIADEMADVLFWLVLMSAELNIDLEEAFERKMKKNETKYPLAQKGEKIGSLDSGKLYNRWQKQKQQSRLNKGR
ncbi:MAG: nucleotide pyrophosphohydrolase [Patescibacteria group bacterium]|nr:nucleotide pyrophosphohydrolase [Patescibacteria group bacterium]